MTTLLDTLGPLATGVSLAGVLCFFAALFRRTTWSIALKTSLDFWTASGLLRLADPRLPWRALVTAAVVVSIRKLVTWGLDLHAEQRDPLTPASSRRE